MTMEKSISPVEPPRLSNAKQKLLEKFLKGQGRGESNTQPAIPRRAVGVPIPLSFPQQQVWVHSQMVGPIPIYNEAVTVYRRGPLDVAALERCMIEILRRHEIWRTTFDMVGESPVQIVQPDPDRFPLPITDLRHHRPDERETEARRLATEDARKPFDLMKGPLLRAILVRVDEEEYRSYLTFHQIVFDAVSVYRVFMPELVALYAAFSAGKPSPLSEPALQYGDFAYWQQNADAENNWAEQVSFWRERLSGELPVLTWPNDHPRPASETHRGAIQRFEFGSELTSSLRAFCRQTGVSSYMALLASYATLLSRYTGQEDILMGGLSAGRRKAETEPLVGYFVNPFALRMDLSGNPTFWELTRRVMGVVLDALANEEVPFQKVLEALHLRPDLRRNPVFQIILSQQPLLPTIEPGWNLATEEVSNGGSKMDMIMVLDERPDAISGPITYNPDLFEASTITRMVEHWQVLLSAALANPDAKLSDLPMLTEREKSQLLVEWNDTQAAIPTDACLHTLIEEQVERTPDAVALEFEGTKLSYRQLNERANQLAHFLQKCGVGTDTLVGISIERSIEMVVGLLGIIKAGGAYVPIDPAYPKDRIAFMLEDANATVLLTQQHVLATLPPHGAKAICLDTEWDIIAQESTRKPPERATSDSLAYMIYTSGSTGRPKGAMNTHRGICNRLLWMQNEYRLTGSDAVLQKTPFSFDVSVWEFFWPLLTGARLVVALPGGHRDGAYLVDLICKQGITVMHFVPSMLRAFLDEPGAKRCRSLREVICSGEALPYELEQAFLNLLPAKLENLYGPTEAAVDVTYWHSTRDTKRSTVPIGKPIWNTQIYILDKYLQPVPAGIAGELHIGGIGLARGYLNRPELTSDKFIPDPFSSQSGARLYKTGDSARFLPDGNIEYLGRIDFQVKIRGFRIELGEIESVLREYPLVREVVVVAREDAPGEMRLVAYVLPKRDAMPSAEELRQHVRRSLPEFMTPSSIVILETFPVTPNGKVDRKALPAPSELGIKLKEEFLAPRDPLEQMLAQLWSRVLKVKRIGIRDNFFDLGGHSILAVRVLVEIEKHYGKRLPLATLIQSPTIGDLAQILRRENWEPSWSCLVPLRAGGSKPPFFLMHAHGGNVLEYHALAERMDPDQPVYALQARGLNGEIPRNQSLTGMVAAYIKEMRSLQPVGPYYLGGFCFGGLLALEAAHQLRTAGEEVALLAIIQTIHPAFAVFQPGTGLFQRWWYRASNRLDLERENSSHRGQGYLFERIRRAWDIARAKTEIAFDNAVGKGDRRRDNPSMPYILQSLTIEHDRARLNYQSLPYTGDVVLFRANKQLRGLLSDEYLGWKQVFRGNLEVCEVPGHQQNMLLEPHVARLASELSCRLLAAQNGSGSEDGVLADPMTLTVVPSE